MESFAERTTLPGIPRLIGAKTRTAKVVWSVVCLAAVTIFSLLIGQLLHKYYSYPTKVTIEVVPIAAPFPSVSLCNMRNLDWLVLNRLNSRFKEDRASWTNLTGDAFIDAYMRTAAKFSLLYRQQIEMSVFQTVLTRQLFAANIEREAVVAAGVPFREFIVSCQFGGRTCNKSRDFSRFFDARYYNCYTFQAPEAEGEGSKGEGEEKGIPGEGSPGEGVENGWSTTVLVGNGLLDRNDEIRVIPGTHEYLSPLSSSEGVRVVIHPPRTRPFPHTEGFDVPPGHSVSFGVRARDTRRIGPPHGHCSHSNPLADEAGDDYRLISCQKACLQRRIVDTCGCVDIALPDATGKRFCTSDRDVSATCTGNVTDDCTAGLWTIYNRIRCVKNVKAAMANDVTTAAGNCGCHPPCDEMTYDVTYSLSKWPTEGFEGDEAYIEIMESENYPARFQGAEDKERLQVFAEYFKPGNRRVAMRDFARLNVYISDGNVQRTVESEDYPLSQLLSDIGGQLGLWVGISIISLLEVLELIIDVVKPAKTKRNNHNKGKELDINS